MKIIPAQTSNIEAIIEAIKCAQNYLASLGIDQWQDGYPNEEVILKDMNQNESYIVTNEYGDVIGTTMFTIRPEPTYKVIDGNWLTSEDAVYGVIHRMAVNDKFRSNGFSKFVFDSFENLLIEKGIASMRIDTHEHNQVMQGILKNRGYQYCGIINLERGGTRLAFEKKFN
jgi:ribosomal protein S18 acetylase RimI-like enzyme